MGKFKKVEGQPGYVRDKISGAVLNINSSSVSQARKRKQAWQEEKQKSEVLASDIDNLKSDVEEIKTLLNKILEVANGNHNN